MWARYPPTPPFHCGENEIQARPITSASVGATPTPATNLRKVIRQSGHSDHFYAAVAEYIRHPSSKRIDAGENPAGSAILLPGGVKVARRFVKPHGVGASPTLAATLTAECG